MGGSLWALYLTKMQWFGVKANEETTVTRLRLTVLLSADLSMNEGQRLVSVATTCTQYQGTVYSIYCKNKPTRSKTKVRLFKQTVQAQHWLAIKYVNRQHNHNCSQNTFRNWTAAQLVCSHFCTININSAPNGKAWTCVRACPQTLDISRGKCASNCVTVKWKLQWRGYDMNIRTVQCSDDRK